MNSTLLLATGTAVAYCPWAYLRLGQGVTGAGRHAELRRTGRTSGARLRLRERRRRHRHPARRHPRRRPGQGHPASTRPVRGPHRVWNSPPIGGAEAIGMGHEIGSLEVGKRADIVLVDTDRAEFTPASPIRCCRSCGRPTGAPSPRWWPAGGSCVRDGACITVDPAELRPPRSRPATASSTPPASPAPRWPTDR